MITIVRRRSTDLNRGMRNIEERNDTRVVPMELLLPLMRILLLEVTDTLLHRLLVVMATLRATRISPVLTELSPAMAMARVTVEIRKESTKKSRGWNA